jgi:hypothetical protein
LIGGNILDFIAKKNGLRPQKEDLKSENDLCSLSFKSDTAI